MKKIIKRIIFKGVRETGEETMKTPKTELTLEQSEKILEEKKKEKRVRGKQFIRFLVVGGTSTVLNYLIYFIFLYFLKTNIILAFIVGFVSGVLFGFVFNKVWTFKSREKFQKEILPYFIVYLVSLGIGTIFIKILTTWGINQYIANIPVIVVTTIMNYFGIKIFVFESWRFKQHGTKYILGLNSGEETIKTPKTEISNEDVGRILDKVNLGRTLKNLATEIKIKIKIKSLQNKIDLQTDQIKLLKQKKNVELLKQNAQK